MQTFKRSISLAILLLITLSIRSYGQTLLEINQQKITRSRNGMIVLGSWAVGNMIVSPLLKQQASGTDRYFYDMNVYWNAVNLLIAGMGYYSAVNDNPSKYDLKQAIKRQHQTEKLLLFNAGLDVGYIMAGLYLRERGLSDDSDRLVGYGRSLVLQGSFLLVFDVLFYLYQREGSKMLDKFMNNLSVSATGVGVRIKL